MQTITVEEVKKRQQAGEQLNLLDVREPDEYAEFNIGGKLIPLGNIQSMQIDDLEEWKEQEIIVHCRSGKRSMIACHFLEAMGFTNTKNLEGGMLEWQAQPGPVK
ncbi:MAG: rhodanese-like domain-containing protein [Williamsia sp.]|nr:rhodanese-like domain-containing protein [Williamsia sp.]